MAGYKNVQAERPWQKRVRLFREAGNYLFPDYSSSISDSTVRTMTSRQPADLWERLARDAERFIKTQTGVNSPVGKRPQYSGRGNSTRGANSVAFSRDACTYIETNTGIRLPVGGYFGLPVKFYEEIMDRLGI